MKKIILLILSMLILRTTCFASTFTGGVTKVGQQESNQVIDSQTKEGIDFAKISIPQKHYKTYTDANGNFTIDKIQIDKPTILSVEKEGYRPFSLTINNGQSLSNPMKIEITKSSPTDIAIDNQIMHLGDNAYSKNSANAGDFRLKSSGPYYSKDFIMTSNAKKSSNYLVIGSIVGLDTKLAKTMGQNNIQFAYSTPTEVFFNGHLIGELKINGDGQQIKIPSQLIKTNKPNQITIKTGHNTLQAHSTDYDDIEIMNLSILSK